MTEYVYLYDGSWEGLLSAVFHAFDSRQWPVAVFPEENAQLGFGQKAVEIATDAEQAKRVETGICRHAGSPAASKVWTAFLSWELEKATIIYRYIRFAVTRGRDIYHALSHPCVAPLEQLCISVSNEAHLLRGFVRFSRLGNGAFYSQITPKNSVLPLIMPFFTDRYSDQPFLIFDRSHAMAGVYDLREWYLVETQGIQLPEYAPEERDCRRLWKQFYDSVEVTGRRNPKCQRSHMPKRYWSNMTEHTLL